MEPPIRRWCSILKVFLVGSLPLGLFMFFLELYNGPDGSLAVFFFWAIFSYASLEYTGVIINACRLARSIDYQELLRDAPNNAGARFFMFLVKHKEKFFWIVVRAVAWLSKLSGPLHYIGSSVAITLECIICLCFQMEYTSLTYQFFRAYGELMFGARLFR
ncbi:hypothetical protein C5167_044086 [Papaver somniferum]|uniref:Uncharacterized protein n=1 Tax=Papaver somniferum TaxID=3469 RepID=A0A4Y7LBD3_PAPSO|nr:hypothetical protein C5167_044086 [Papaver somniferum]